MENIAESLSPLERRILPLIKENISSRDLATESNLKDVEVLRALQWLENKQAINVKRESREIIEIDVNGKNAL